MSDVSFAEKAEANLELRCGVLLTDLGYYVFMLPRDIAVILYFHGGIPVDSNFEDFIYLLKTIVRL